MQQGESKPEEQPQMLAEITTLSHAFGGSRYVRGGGGNTSVKDADTLWVKPSGTTLAGMKPETFVALERSKIGVLYTTEPPASAEARESLVKALMQDAVCAGSQGRPSVEAPLHNVFDARYVVHTHPALLNGLACAKDGATACVRLFPDALWVPYIDPGYTLCMEVREQMARYQQMNGKQPDVLVLENHGLFVAGDSPEAIHETYADIMSVLEEAYTSADVPLAFAVGAAPAAAVAEEECRQMQTLLGEDAAVVEVSGPFAVAEGPLTPDHIVYAKSYSYQGPLDEEGLAAFRQQHGYAPRVVVTPNGVYGAGRSEKQAALALEFAQDASHVVQLAEAFGGVQWMHDAARRFIENWEVESYRSKVSA